MAYSIYDKFITRTDSGETIPGASVSVYEFGGALAAIYARRDGAPTIDWPSGQMDNPLPADADGRIQFYAAPGRYNISATSDGDTIAYPDVLILDEPSAIAGELASRVQFVDSIADLTALTGMVDGQQLRRTGEAQELLFFLIQA